MPLVTTKKMLKDAQEGHYAVGAFNVENMEMVMAVIEAAEEVNSPVIMQTTPSTVKYAGLDYYLANVKAAAERAVGRADGNCQGRGAGALYKFPCLLRVRISIPLTAIQVVFLAAHLAQLRFHRDS